MWWGTLGFCALEGMGFALAIGAYLYLAQVNPQWPLSADIAPNHWPGTIVLVILLVSIWPNHLAERHAREENRGAVQRDLVIMSVVGVGRWSRSASTSSRSSTCAGTRTPTARRPGSCSGCTPRTSSPTSATRWC